MHFNQHLSAMLMMKDGGTLSGKFDSYCRRVDDMAGQVLLLLHVQFYSMYILIHNTYYHYYYGKFDSYCQRVDDMARQVLFCYFSIVVGTIVHFNTLS